MCAVLELATTLSVAYQILQRPLSTYLSWIYATPDAELNSKAADVAEEVVALAEHVAMQVDTRNLNSMDAMMIRSQILVDSEVGILSQAIEVPANAFRQLDRGPVPVPFPPAMNVLNGFERDRGASKATTSVCPTT